MRVRETMQKAPVVPPAHRGSGAFVCLFVCLRRRLRTIIARSICSSVIGVPGGGGPCRAPSAWRSLGWAPAGGGTLKKPGGASPGADVLPIGAADSAATETGVRGMSLRGKWITGHRGGGGREGGEALEYSGAD
jgi:hypothetical protein